MAKTDQPAGVAVDRGVRQRTPRTTAGIRAANKAERPAAHMTGVARALELDLIAERAKVDRVYSLLWDAHPECCGCPTWGAEYMGSREELCCGQPTMDTLSDAQIVASLRAMFKERPNAKLCGPSREEQR